MDTPSASPGAVRKRRRRRRSVAPSSHDLKRRRVISTIIKGVTKENVNKCRVNELKRCVKERKH